METTRTESVPERAAAPEGDVLRNDPTLPVTAFDDAYTVGTAPRVIGEPQPAVVDLELGGWIRGVVLDAGCGTGEHTIHLAALGYTVLGVDASAPAVERARANAAGRGAHARFEVADAVDLPAGPIYHTVLDSALFHLFGAADRARYLRSLHGACRPGALVHVLALSDAGPGFGPRSARRPSGRRSGRAGRWRSCGPAPTGARCCGPSTPRC